MSILGGVQMIPEGFILVVWGMELGKIQFQQFQTRHGGSWIICVTYLQPRWTSGKRRMRWWERANPSGRVSGPPWWCWCLHRPSPRCLSSLHLWGWSDGGKKKNLLALLASWFSLRHACFPLPPWPTCAGRVNIAVLWVGMTICHGWTPTCRSI